MSNTILDMLSTEEKNAITVKAALLDTDILDKMRERNPELSLLEQFVLRGIKKQAANAIISQKKPGWVARATQILPTMLSKDATVKENAESSILALYEEIGSLKIASQVIESAEKQAKKFSTNKRHLLECAERIHELFSKQATGADEEEEEES